jgi:hypothetical protein
MQLLSFVFSWITNLQPGLQTSATAGDDLHEALLHHKEWLNNFRRDIELTNGNADVIIADGRVTAVQSLPGESVQILQEPAV